MIALHNCCETHKVILGGNMMEKRMKELAAIIQEAKDAYYNDGESIMSDKEYDALEAEFGKDAFINILCGYAAEHPVAERLDDIAS